MQGLIEKVHSKWVGHSVNPLSEKPKGKKDNSEYLLCKNLSFFLKTKYPNILFHFDMAGLNLSMRQAVANKVIQKKRAFPDLFILAPTKEEHGFFLEIKKEGTKIYLKDGCTLVSDKHIQEQHNYLLELRTLGYYAEFGIGLDDCIKQIDNYFRNSRF